MTAALRAARLGVLRPVSLLAPGSSPIEAFADRLVNEELERFARHLRAENKSEQTVVIYGEAVDQLLRHLAERGMPSAPEHIRREHVEDFIVAPRAGDRERPRARAPDRLQVVRAPASTSARRTHVRNVSAVIPNFEAIEVIVAHCDACSA